MTRPARPKRRLDESFGALVRAISNVMYVDITEQLAPLSISPEEWTVIVGIAHGGADTPQALQAMLRVDRATISRRLAVLETRAFVTRERDATDRRRHRLTLTSAGKRLLPKGDSVAEAINADALQALSLPERRQLIALLQRVLATVAANQGSLPASENVHS